MSKILLDDEPLVAPKKIAVALKSINKALILQQIDFWVSVSEKNKSNFRDGHYWVYKTYSQWVEELCVMSRNTVIRTIESLVDDGYVITGNFNQKNYDKTRWYRLDYEKLENLIAESRDEKQATTQNGYRPSTQNGYTPLPNLGTPIPEITLPENTITENTGIYNNSVSSIVSASIEETGEDNKIRKGHSADAAMPHAEEITQTPINFGNSGIFRRVTEKYGETRAKNALRFVNRYIDKEYPKVMRHYHQEENLAKRIVFAEKLLDCSNQILDDDDAALYKTLFKALPEIQMKDQGINPEIYYITKEPIMGYWLHNLGTVSFDMLAGTPYQYVEVNYT